MLLLHALTPLLVLVICILGLRLSVAKAALLSLLTTLATTIFIWLVPLDILVASSIKGSFITLEIGLILIGAIFFAHTINQTSIPKTLKTTILSLTPDKHAQSLIIGFLFVSLIEAAAGFGTPALIAAPLLVALGFKPLTAIITTIIGNSAAVTFGAINTPLSIGIINGLGESTLAELGPQALTQLAHHTALINIIPATLLPLAIVFFVHRLEHLKSRPPYFFALLVGLSFSVPYFLTARFLSPDLPSLIGAATGLTLIILYLKFLTPQSSPLNPHQTLTPHQTLKALSPYILVILFLLLTRLPSLPLNSLLATISINFTSLYGTHLTHIFWPLLSPGLVLILTAIITSALYSHTSRSPMVFAQAAKKSLRPITMLLVITIMVQIMLYADTNARGLPNLPQYIGASISLIPIPWLITAPFIGAFGAFVTGSATVSNLLFAAVHAQAATTTSLSLFAILGLQTIGAAAGNMIALHNLIAVSSVVGQPGDEANLIRKLFPKSLLYILLTLLSATILWSISLI